MSDQDINGCGAKAGPLAGLKVIEIGVAMAGPFCAMMLGDYGADVLKIERVDGGDDSRAWPPYFYDQLGYYYASANRNKRGIALDLKKPEGKSIARELIRTADVLVHNLRPGVLERLELDWEILSKDNPRLIYCAISGFGHTGELAKEPANDLFMQAYSGGMSITGDPDGGPAKMGISVADIGAGMFATIGVLMALQARTVTGRGQQVNTSLLEGQVSMLTHFLTRHFATGEVPGRSGSGALKSPTYRAYEASDEWVVIAAFNERMWQGLARALGHGEWINDKQFMDAEARTENRAQLIGLIAAVVQTQPADYWIEKLKAEEVPCSLINRIDRVVKLPQVGACEMVTEIALEGLGSMRMAGLPVKFSETPGQIRRPPPRLGQHTEEVLSAMGYPPEEIGKLQKDKVAGIDLGWRGAVE